MRSRDEEQNKIADLMNSDIQNKNIVTQSEFAQYLPLFDNRIRIGNTYDEPTLKNLIERYRMRFNLHHAITIISDDRSRIVDTRPPMFIQIPALNNHIQKASELITTYNNIMSNDSQPKNKKIAVGEVLQKAINISIDKDPKYQENKKTAMGIMSKTDIPATEPTSKITSGLQWD